MKTKCDCINLNNTVESPDVCFVVLHRHILPECFFFGSSLALVFVVGFFCLVVVFFLCVFFFLTEVQNKTWEMDTIKLFQASSSAGHLNFAILATVI